MGDLWDAIRKQNEAGREVTFREVHRISERDPSRHTIAIDIALRSGAVFKKTRLVSMLEANLSRMGASSFIAEIINDTFVA